MAQQIYVNLPVADLKAAIAFFQSLGFLFDPQFTDDTATCMILGDNMFAMLVKRERFQDFTPRPVADAKTATEVLLCLNLDSREAVDEMVRKAVAAGGQTYKEAQDHGFMYSHGFMDPDGHIWEVIHMPPGAVPGGGTS